jgi:hypothetical protein
MKITIQENDSRRHLWPWSAIVLIVCGSGLLLFPIFVPVSLPLKIMSGFGLAMILVGIRVFSGKKSFPRPVWVIILGTVLIFGFKMLLSTSNAPTWFLAMLIPLILFYAWLQDKGKAP